MSELLQKLKGEGVDTAGTLARFSDDEALYETSLAAFLRDENFGKLGDTSEETEVYTIACELKGVAGNLGITPIYDLLCKLSDAVRSGLWYEMDVCMMVYEVLDLRDKLVSIL